MMFNNISRARLVGAWLAAVAVLAAGAVVMNLNVTLGGGMLLLASCLVPPESCLNYYCSMFFSELLPETESNCDSNKTNQVSDNIIVRLCIKN